MAGYLPHLLAVSFLSLVTALRPCQLRSHNCLTSYQQYNKYECPSRGHFRHPQTNLRYYKCIGIGYMACDCACKYRDMCFSPITNTCQFSFLPEVRNCTEDTQSTSTIITSTIGTVKPTTTKPKPKPHVKDLSQFLQGARTYDIQYRFKDQHINLHHGQSIPKNVVPVKQSHAEEYNFVRQDKLTAQEVLLQERGINPLLVDDISILPAWAVAIVVLCVVMLLVLLVIFLY